MIPPMRLRGRVAAITGGAPGTAKRSPTSPTTMNGISSLKIGPVPAQLMVSAVVVTVSLMRRR